MANEFSCFDPRRVQFVWNGILVQGYAKGTEIEADRTEDGASVVKGGRGDTTKVVNPDTSGMIKVILMDSSPTNDLLAAKYRAQELGDLTATGPALLRDLNGRSRASATNAWIRKLPTMGFNTDGTQTREWIFDCAELDMFPGGRGTGL